MKLTAVVVTGLIIFLGVYDLVVVTADLGIENSVSRFMQDSALEHPMVCFAVAFVCGHIFGYMKPRCKKNMFPGKMGTIEWLKITKGMTDKDRDRLLDYLSSLEFFREKMVDRAKRDVIFLEQIIKDNEYE